LPAQSAHLVEVLVVDGLDSVASVIYLRGDKVPAAALKGLDLLVDLL